MRPRLPKRIVYTRHPQCLHNVDNDDALRRGIENRKSVLTPAGEIQRDITAAYLQKEFPEISAVFCSTYMRTRTIPVAAGFESILRETHLLDERNMGVWHTNVRDDVLRMHPGEDDRIQTVGYYEYSAPGGESCIGVENRLTELLLSETLGDPDATVFVSGHGISGLCFRRLLMKASVEDWYSWFSTPKERLANASVTVFDRTNDTYVCTRYNIVPWEGMIDPSLLAKKSVEA